MAVVDPGVGSQRRPIVVTAADQFFVGPDNGIFSYILERERDARVFHLTNVSYFAPWISSTFHGRDIFAPVAGALSQGVAPEELGVEIHDYVRLPVLTPTRKANGDLVGQIIHIDRFGNCITNISRSELPAAPSKRGLRLTVNRKEIRRLQRFFAEAGNSAEAFAIWGSAGFLEIAANNRSAAEILKAKRGQKVIVLTD